MAKKKITGLRKCIAEGCNASLTVGKVRFAMQYCERHRATSVALKALRQPCRIIDCKNPATEDGYCDGCRPFPADIVPLREDWLQGEGLMTSNGFDSCSYCNETSLPKGSRVCRICAEKIAQIRQEVMND
ncbi:MAG: hypothetical protein CMB45_05075 [Euryarchaeota archaeon]|nr:hypothetical protein [Euryarchaeota archaeon]